MIKRPPTKAILQGEEYLLRNRGNWYEAYRIICIFNDDELSAIQKWNGAIVIMFEDYKKIFENVQKYNEACCFIKYFIDRGKTTENTKNSANGVNISFFQDMEMIVDSLNTIKDRDIRLSYIHWWTFLGDVYNHEPTGIYKTVLEIRYKLKHNKKLEVWEREFYNFNRALVDLKPNFRNDEEKFLDDILGVAR